MRLAPTPGGLGIDLKNSSTQRYALLQKECRSDLGRYLVTLYGVCTTQTRSTLVYAKSQCKGGQGTGEKIAKKTRETKNIIKLCKESNRARRDRCWVKEVGSRFCSSHCCTSSLCMRSHHGIPTAVIMLSVIGKGSNLHSQEC